MAILTFLNTRNNFHELLFHQIYNFLAHWEFCKTHQDNQIIQITPHRPAVGKCVSGRGGAEISRSLRRNRPFRVLEIKREKIRCFPRGGEPDAGCNEDFGARGL